MPGKEKYVIISAPSGAGKTTIVKHLLAQPEFRLEFSVSACSRAKRTNETDGVDYLFMSVDEFKKRIGKDEFIEWEEVYKDHFYGTLKTETKRIFDEGNSVLFDVDVKGGVNLKNIFGTNAVSIFIMPPSVEELERRLRARRTDSEESIKKRVAKAKDEMTFVDHFDAIIVNDRLNIALDEAEKILKKFLNL